MMLLRFTLGGGSAAYGGVCARMLARGAYPIVLGLDAPEQFLHHDDTWALFGKRQQRPSGGRFIIHTWENVFIKIHMVQNV